MASLVLVVVMATRVVVVEEFQLIYSADMMSQKFLCMVSLVIYSVMVGSFLILE